MRPLIGALTLTAMMAVESASAQPRCERNVVYGMHSGLALLMDPELANRVALGTDHERATAHQGGARRI